MESPDSQIKLCRATLKILQYSLIWPNTKNEMKAGKWYYIRVLLFLLLTVPWGLSILIHLVLTIKNNVDVHISEDISILVALTGIYYTTFTFVKNQNEIARLLQDLSNFTRFGVPPHFESLDKKFRFWSWFTYIYTVIGITMYSLSKLAQKPTCERINLEKNLHENCGFNSAVWAPFEVNYFPMYQLVYGYTFVSCQIIIKLVLMISFLAMEMAHHLVLRVRHLQEMVVKCFEGNARYEERKKMLKKCVECHTEIIQLSKRLNECFRDGMLAHLTMTGVICACIEKQIVNQDGTLAAVLHFSAWIAALSVACYGGQHLITASDVLPEILWSSQWYEVDSKLIKDLSFMLLASQKKITLTAGSYSVVSYPLLVSVLKMSYSVLCYLTK